MKPARSGARRGLAAALLGLACSGEPPAGEALPEAPPSALLLTLDTLRWDHLSRNGHGRATTPSLDRLAEEGVYFARCYAQSSWTLPSMLSLFSSLSPAVFGVTEGVRPLPRPGRPPRPALGREEVFLEIFSDAYLTLPEVLATHGYATAGFSTNGHLRAEQGFAQGFEHFDQTSCMWGSAGCVFDAATAWLDAHLAAPSPRPFFLWIHLFDPHFDRREGSPPVPVYEPAPGYEQLFGSPEDAGAEARVRLDYDRKLRYADDRLGAFAEALRARALLDRAVLVVAADHGEEFHEHGLWGHSKSLRETLVRVPLLFRLPGGRPRGVVDALVRNLDVAPTLLDLLGVPAPPGMGGASLRPALEGRPLEPREAYGETRRFGRDLRFRVDPALGRKLVLDLETGRRQLFDPAGDPGERSDLAEAEPERAAELERALRAAIAEMEALGEPVERGGALSDGELERLRRLGYAE